MSFSAETAFFIKSSKPSRTPSKPSSMTDFETLRKLELRAYCTAESTSSIQLFPLSSSLYVLLLFILECRRILVLDGGDTFVQRSIIISKLATSYVYHVVSSIHYFSFALANHETVLIKSPFWPNLNHPFSRIPPNHLANPPPILKT